MLISGFTIGLFLQAFIPPVPFVKGHFLSDSVALGAPVLYALTATYSYTQEVEFPDSSHAFTPFELRHRTYVPSQSLDSLYIYDSAIYTLASFALDKKQSLRLSVLFSDGTDTLRRYTSYDTIHVFGVLDTLLPSAQPQPHLSYLKVAKRFNYIYFSIGIGIGIGILILLYWVLQRPIRRSISCYRLRRRYEAFLRHFEAATQPSPTDAKGIENGLLVWKQYMEHLSKIPYTRLTTQEILSNEQETAFETLLHFDKWLYAGIGPKEAGYMWEKIRRIAENKYLSAYEEARLG